MKKIIVLLMALVLFSCNKKEVLLPQTNVSNIKEIHDHSPIYMFFKTEGKDTIAEVNRKNSISSTNWIFNIDRRLTLEKVMPEISKLQAKKEASAHTKKGAMNVFSYADTLHKNLAFVDFTDVKFLNNDSPKGEILYFSKNETFTYKSKKFNFNEFENLVASMPIPELNELNISFDSKMNYGQFLFLYIQLKSLEIKRNFKMIYLF